MKVLHFVGTASNKYGGLEKYYIELGRQLKTAKRGRELVLIYKRKISCQPYLDELDELGISHYEADSNKGYGKFIRQIAGIIHTEKPDIVHLNFASSIETVLFYAVSRFYRHPTLISTYHCAAPVDSFRHYIVNGIICCLSSRVLCVSDHIRRSLSKYYGDKKVRLLYLGIPSFHYDKQQCRAERKISPQTTAIGCVAYHDYVKGVDVLIQATALLKHTYGLKDFKVYQIGGAPFPDYHTYLKNEIDRLGVGDEFRLLGLRDDVDRWLTACDIYCQPSRSEGVPLSIMEASLAELPVVATDVGGIPEAALHDYNALISPANSPEKLAANLARLIAEPALRKQLGANGRKLAVEKFDISRQVSLLVDSYSEYCKS